MLIVTTLTLVPLLMPIPNAPTPASTALDALLDEAWERRLADNPFFATQVGDPRFRDQTPRADVASHAQRLQRARQYKARAAAIDPNGPKGLSPDERIDRRLFMRQQDETIAALSFGDHLMPLTGRGGFHISFAELAKWHPLKTAADYEAYIARLEAFSGLVDDHLELMEAGIERGLLPPTVALKGWEGPVEAHIVDDPKESLLYAPFAKLPAALGAEARQSLEARAKKAVETSVIAGYAKLRDFLKTRYVPKLRTSVGVSELPGGAAYYEHLVRKFTTLDVSPKAVHERGVEEVARIRAEMLALIEKIGFEGDFAAFLKHLRTDDRFYAKSADELMSRVRALMKRVDAALPRLFEVLPKTGYTIERVPDYLAPHTHTAYYWPPSGDGTRPGGYYVNTHDLRSRPLYEIEALSLHEAVPGHHLQIALAQEQQALRPFRRHTMITAFVEGWALYAERLGLEVGFYEDPYSDFGRLSYEMWRACRLVVDTGLHALGWTRAQAIAFMAEHTALSQHNIETEVDRYIAWPGQALGYKMGELKIRALRKEAEEALGDRFDVRAFHRVVLQRGAIPLDLLAEEVRAWVASAKTAAQ